MTSGEVCGDRRCLEVGQLVLVEGGSGAWIAGRPRFRARGCQPERGCRAPMGGASTEPLSEEMDVSQAAGSRGLLKNRPVECDIRVRTHWFLN